jgi:hypothetical protein
MKNKIETKTMDRLLESEETINEVESTEVTSIEPQIITRVLLSPEDKQMFQDEITKAVFSVARNLGIEMYRIFWSERGKQMRGLR